MYLALKSLKFTRQELLMPTLKASSVFFFFLSFVYIRIFLWFLPCSSAAVICQMLRQMLRAFIRSFTVSDFLIDVTQGMFHFSLRHPVR